MSPEDEVTYLQRLSGQAAEHVAPSGAAPEQAAHDGHVRPRGPGSEKATRDAHVALEDGVGVGNP